MRRFRDESRLQYKLSQGNLHIVRSIGSGTTIAPTTSALLPYTVLEWLDGHSLAHEFNERREAGLHGRPVREVVSLLDTAIDAVAYAHAQGVIHRDLNPGNLFLARTPSGIKLKVLDFGVAKVMADAAIAMGATAKTIGNVRMFAPAYGAPEQFDDRIGAIGPWTDVYAIALVILEALTDRTVMDGEHLGEFAAKALDAAHRPSPRAVGAAVGDETEKVLAQALSLDPTARPRDAGELWGMLKHALQVDAPGSGRPPHAERSGSGESPVTLRMKESRGSVRPPHGGTLRIEPGPPRSATAWLAATPVPSQSPLTPMPPPSELSSQVYFSPSHSPLRPRGPGVSCAPRPPWVSGLRLALRPLRPRSTAWGCSLRRVGRLRPWVSRLRRRVRAAPSAGASFAGPGDRGRGPRAPRSWGRPASAGESCTSPVHLRRAALNHAPPRAVHGQDVRGDAAPSQSLPRPPTAVPSFFRAP